MLLVFGPTIAFPVQDLRALQSRRCVDWPFGQISKDEGRGMRPVVQSALTLVQHLMLRVLHPRGFTRNIDPQDIVV